MKEQSLRQVASHLLSAALFEMFPNVDLWLAEATDIGFVCECFFPHPIHPEMLALLEQRMKQIIQEKRQIRLLEMVAFSAGALLEKEGHHEESSLLKKSQDPRRLVEVVEMGSFHQLTQGPLLQNTSEISAFKLLSLEKIEGKGMRIEGIVAFSKEELKKKIKLLASFKEHNYQRVGESLGFWSFCEAGVLWLQKGIEARLKVQKIFFPDVSFVECRGNSEEILKFYCKDCCHIRADTTPDLRSSSFALQQFIFPKSKEFIEILHSCLHSIHKTLMILGFDSWVRTFGKPQKWSRVQFPSGVKIENIKGPSHLFSADWMAEDFLGRPIQIVSIKQSKKNAERGEFLICEAFIERILAIMLEKNLRTLFW